MQSFSSRIWTRVAMSISYDDNRYTTGTSTKSLHHGHLHESIAVLQSQFIMPLVCTQFVLFDPYIGPYQVLPARVRVDVGVIAMKG